MSNRRREGTGGHLAGDWGTESQKSSENVGGEKAEECFIASVVYGDANANAHEVKILREYRDNVLMQDEIGRRFINWYYGGGGERMAEFVRGRGGFLIPIIRKGLDFIVEDYKQRRI